MADPQIVEVLERHIDSILEGLHTAIPGRIESYDKATRKATVKPLVRLRMKTGPLVDIPPISEIPIMLPSSKAFSMDFDLVAGDSVLIICTEVAIGNWLQNTTGEIADPEDSSRFNLTDAVAIPGLWPFSFVPESPVKIGQDGAQLVLTTPAGTVASLMDDLWTELAGVTNDINTWASTISATGVTPVLGGAFAPLVAAFVPRLISIQTKAQRVGSILK